LASESSGDKTLPATPRRREEARKKGQVSRSAEVNSAFVVLAAIGVLTVVGPRMMSHLKTIMRSFLSRDAAVSSSADAYTVFQSLSGEALSLLLPFLIPLLIVGVIVNLAQVGFLFTTSPLGPRWGALNPITGFGRKFGRRGWVEMAKAVFKVAVIGTVAYLTVVADFERFVPLLGADSVSFVGQVAQAFQTLGVRVGLALLVIAALDFGYQRWEYEKSMRMSRDEIEREQKQTDGDPQMKSRIRFLQRQLSRNRMISAVAEADVVITNPVHVAVALKYDRESMAAPVVVASGKRKMAAKIKEVAREANVPIMEDPPLARLLFKETEVGQAIPVELYQAVAQILAHVWKLRRGAEGAGVQMAGGGVL